MSSFNDECIALNTQEIDMRLSLTPALLRAQQEIGNARQIILLTPSMTCCY
jgi:hypothetical protein